MRTTLDLDEDILAAAKSLGMEPQAVYGFVPLTAPGQHIVTSDMVRAMDTLNQ